MRCAPGNPRPYSLPVPLFRRGAGLEATAQGLLSAVNGGLGAGMGALLGGVMFEHLGARGLYTVSGAVGGVVMAVAVACEVGVRRAGGASVGPSAGAKAPAAAAAAAALAGAREGSSSTEGAAGADMDAAAGVDVDVEMVPLMAPVDGAAVWTDRAEGAAHDSDLGSEADVESEAGPDEERARLVAAA